MFRAALMAIFIGASLHVTLRIIRNNLKKDPHGLRLKPLRKGYEDDLLANFHRRVLKLRQSI
jgi:hypothetical protein